MQRFLQQVVDGVVNGSIYAFLALALVLVFRSTHLVNLAQGQMAMFSTYIAWELTEAGQSMWLAVLVTVAASFVAGAVIERVVIRPVERSSPLAVVIVTIGLFLVLSSLANWIWTGIGRGVPNLLWFGSRVYEPAGGVRVNGQEVTIVAALLGVVGLLYLLLWHTKTGLALRAVASNPESSRLVGIRVGRILMLAWGLAGAIGALAGALVAPKLTLSPNMMLIVLIYAFAAATLGGFDSPVGAVVGGVTVGVVESLAATYVGFVGSDLKLTVAFALILLVLLVRPSGLFGSREVTRA